MVTSDWCIKVLYRKLFYILVRQEKFYILTCNTNWNGGMFSYTWSKVKMILGSIYILSYLSGAMRKPDI